MPFIANVSRSLLDRATAYYINGQPVTVMNAQGEVVIGAAPPTAPTIAGTITDRVYELGSGPYTINLLEKLPGSTSYVVTANPNVSVSGNTLTITPTAITNATRITIVGRNAGGDSPPLSFALTINAVAPKVVVPLDDIQLDFGVPNVTIPLDDHFSGVSTYSVAPAANGATISGRNLVLSAAQLRSLDVTVTGTNSTGQSVSDEFLFAVIQVTTPWPRRSSCRWTTSSLILACRTSPSPWTIIFPGFRPIRLPLRPTARPSAGATWSCLPRSFAAST